MKLAIYQTAGKSLDIAANLDLMASAAEQATQAGADFLILPELFLTGYNIGDATRQLAMFQQDAPMQRAAHIAQHYQIALLVGYAEREGDHLYNSAALIDAQGNWAGNYRKIHLFGSEEQRLFCPGNQWIIRAIAGIQVGVLICFDVEFPEAVRTLAAQGAELIAIPTALAYPHELIPKLLVPARALENQVFVAYANRVGMEADLRYCGLSCVVSPDGKDCARAGEAEDVLLMADIDLTAIAQERLAYDYLQQRRLDLYCSDVQSSEVQIMV